jgi:hypothetical protein
MMIKNYQLKLNEIRVIYDFFPSFLIIQKTDVRFKTGFSHDIN